MSIFNLFKKKKESSKYSEPFVKQKLEYFITSGIISIDSIDFIGHCIISENKKYLAASHEPLFNTPNKLKQGKCILLEDEKLVYQLKFNRPNDPHVSNNGFFAFNDWKTHADSITSFYVLNSKFK